MVNVRLHSIWHKNIKSSLRIGFRICILKPCAPKRTATKKLNCSIPLLGSLTMAMQRVSKYISPNSISGYCSLIFRQHSRKSPSDMRMMLLLCTAVTLRLPCALAKSNANFATLLEAISVITLIL